MKLKVSKKVFAHVDCDSFFASCEILKNPSLKGKYVCVGSEIIIAASYNAKKLWVKCGTPIWEAEKLLKGKKAYFFGVDIPYYQKVSQKLMDFLRENTLDVRKFSIDEAFVEITGLSEMYNISLELYIAHMQQEILQRVWIPVSIGVSNTRLRAKLFSKIRKPFGYYISLDSPEIYKLFEELNFRDIPFIGSKTAKKLDFYISSIHDYIELWYREIVRRFWKNWGKIWLELVGVEAMGFENKAFAKSLGRARGFNREMTGDMRIIFQKILLNLERFEQELFDTSSEIRHIRLLLIDSDWKKYSAEYEFPDYICQHKEHVAVLKGLLKQIFIPGKIYRKTGVFSHDLRSRKNKQLSLFWEQNILSEKSEKLESVLAEITKKFWDNIVYRGK